jgi:hypothetical protein
LVRSIRAIAAVLALSLLTVAQPAPAASALSQLRGIPELKGWFNASKGHTRLIFLLSPT